MTLLDTFNARLALAKRRVSGVYDNLAGRAKSAACALPGSGSLPFVNCPSVLSEREINRGSDFANMFPTRDTEVEFRATNRAGVTGNYKCSVNSLLLIEPSYDDAKRNIDAWIDSRVADRILSYSPDPGVLAATNGPLGHQTFDPRLLNGEWARMPFGSIGNLPKSGEGGRDPYEAMWIQLTGDSSMSGSFQGWTRPIGAPIRGYPFPQNWRKLYPGPKLFDSSGYPNNAFIADLTQLLASIQMLIEGANGMTEWHPAVQTFNNGTLFSGKDTPWGGSATIQAAVRADYIDNPGVKLFHDHRFAYTVRGSNYSTVNAWVRPGPTDAYWIGSCTERRRRNNADRTERTKFLWESSTYDVDFHAADAVADYMRFANLARFLADLGASAHVHACTLAHNVMARKAYMECTPPLLYGTGINGYVQRLEREQAMREEKAISLAGTVGGASMGLAGAIGGARGGASDSQSSPQNLLSGAVVMSAQLFMVNPYVGAVALAICGIAAFITYMVASPSARCRPEDTLIRDGETRVRASDREECTDTDIFGGNQYPHTRKEAIEGRPVKRIKDENGTEIR